MIDRQFIGERHGRQFVPHTGLLIRTHEQGLKAIRRRLVQFPADDNGQAPIVAAEVETSKGTFGGTGDAPPANVGRAMLTATIRRAETRAKARAIRDARNIGVAAVEDMGEECAEVALARAPARDDRSSTSYRGNDRHSHAPRRRAIVTLARARDLDLSRPGVDADHLSESPAVSLIGGCRSTVGGRR